MHNSASMLVACTLVITPVLLYSSESWYYTPVVYIEGEIHDDQNCLFKLCIAIPVRALR